MVHRAGIECAGSAGVGFPDGEGESRVSGSGCQGGVRRQMVDLILGIWAR